MKYTIKFTEDKTVFDMNWDVLVPDVKKRGAINVNLDTKKNVLTYQIESLHEFEAESKEQALEMANKKKLDWAGVKTVSSIIVVEEADSEIIEVVEINAESKILNISTTPVNFKDALVKMNSAGATHICTNLMGHFNFIYDLEMVEQLAQGIKPKKQALKVINASDLDDYAIGIQNCEKIIVDQDVEISKELIEVSKLAINLTTSDRRKEYEKKRIKKTVSFNADKDTALLDVIEEMQKNGIDFSNWVKQKLLEESDK